MSAKYANPAWKIHYSFGITDARHQALIQLVQTQLQADSHTEFLTIANLPAYEALAPEFGTLAVLEYYLAQCGVAKGI